MGNDLKITCTIDTKRLTAVQGLLSEKTIRKITARSLNRAGVTVRKEASQRIKKRLRLKSSEIKEALPISNKPKAEQPINSQYLEISAAAKGVSLSKFKPKQTNQGVRVNITGKSTVIRRSFLAQMKNASRATVFKRKRLLKSGVDVRRVGSNRKELPIAKLGSVSIHSKLMQHSDALSRIGSERFSEEIESRYKHEINKAK